MDFRKLPVVQDQIKKCVRCGSCRSVCPVFREVQSETAAPRGHVFMVQMLRDGVVNPEQDVYERLSACLLCETCTVNCPSGIDVHELNAAARSYIYENNPTMAKEMIFENLWTNPGLLKTSMQIMSGVQKLGLQNLARNIGLTKLLPGDMSQAEEILTDIPFKSAKSQLPEINPPKGEKKFTIGYFLGCGTDLFNPDVAKATVEVLTSYGCEVIIPNSMKCCGLPHVANGKLDTARQLAAHNIKIFNSYSSLDYIVTDCSSCSAALSEKNMKFMLQGLKIEDEAKKFYAKVIDLTKFLVEVLNVQPVGKPSSKQKVTYHDPCHLANAQGIKSQPRDLLQRIPGVEFIEMANANTCCGGSGTYSLTHYDLSMKILDKKMDNAMNTGADIIATCCPSCMMQLKYGTRRHKWNAKVMHPVELLSANLK